MLPVRPMQSVTIDFDNVDTQGQTVEWLVNQVRAAGVELTFDNGAVQIGSASSVTGGWGRKENP